MLEAILTRIELAILFGELMMNAALLCIKNPFMVIYKAITNGNFTYLIWLPVTLIDIIIFVITTILNLVCFIYYFILFPKIGCNRVVEINNFLFVKQGVTNGKNKSL